MGEIFRGADLASMPWPAPEDLRVDPKWVRLLDEGFIYVGAETMDNLRAASQSGAEHLLDALSISHLQDLGFEYSFAGAYVGGNPRSGQIDRTKVAVFIKPHDWARDTEALRVYADMRQRQAMTKTP